MSRRVETLDDLIDRVAASLTQAPQESSFGERVAAGLDDGRGFPQWMRAAALAALIAAVVGVSLIQRPSSDRPIVRTTPAPAAPFWRASMSQRGQPSNRGRCVPANRCRAPAGGR